MQFRDRLYHLSPCLRHFLTNCNYIWGKQTCLEISSRHVLNFSWHSGDTTRLLHGLQLGLSRGIRSLTISTQKYVFPLTMNIEKPNVTMFNFAVFNFYSTMHRGLVVQYQSRRFNSLFCLTAYAKQLDVLLGHEAGAIASLRGKNSHCVFLYVIVC